MNPIKSDYEEIYVCNNCNRGQKLNSVQPVLCKCYSKIFRKEKTKLPVRYRAR